MTENFRTSEFDNLFDAHSIKTPFYGASFKEINDALITATNNNKKIKIVLRCLDLHSINSDKNSMRYELDDYPNYLYDDNIFNDVKYVFNKNVIIETINSLINTKNKTESTSFDDYATWYQLFVFSKKTVDERYERPKKETDVYKFSNYDKTRIQENINMNVIELAKKYPNIDFYLYYPPYSIYYWDDLNQKNIINKRLDEIEYCSKLLVEIPNIHLYSFVNEFDIVSNLNNYKDIEHYSEKINSLILNQMKREKYLVTKDNINKMMKTMKDFYLSYNYEKLFK